MVLEGRYPLALKSGANEGDLPSQQKLLEFVPIAEANESPVPAYRESQHG